MAKKITISPQLLEAIVNALNEGICGLGLADDADEVIASNLEDMKPAAVRKWCEQWDMVIAFHNEHSSKKAKYSDPWMVKELDSQLEEQNND